MKKIFTVLAIISSIMAIIFAVLPISNLAVFPSIAALIFGIAAFYFSRKTGQVKKIIQFTFLLTIMALAITIYKAVFIETGVTDTKDLDTKETQLKEEAIEELEGLEIEDLDISESELEDIQLEQ